jgi:hypothetical protein
MSINTYGILPLGGNATRMNHLPKFLLPCKIGITLLDNIINIFNNNNVFSIVSCVSETNHYLLQNNNKIEKIVVNTKTMAETVYKLMKSINENNTTIYKSILLMPDTYITVKNEITSMINMLDTYDIVVLLWEIQEYQIGKVGQCNIENNKIIDIIDKDPNCNYSYFWGSIGWRSTMNKHIDPEWETIGNLLKKSIELDINIGYVICNNNYYDCGTYSEYFTMIKKEI